MKDLFKRLSVETLVPDTEIGHGVKLRAWRSVYGEHAGDAFLSIVTPLGAQSIPATREEILAVRDFMNKLLEKL